MLGGLDPYTAYAYRLVAHNALGESSGASTGLLLTDAVGTRVGAPPGVRALGSASFFVEWARHTTHCRPVVSWRLEVLNAAAAGDGGGGGGGGGVGGGSSSSSSGSGGSGGGAVTAYLTSPLGTASAPSAS